MQVSWDTSRKRVATLAMISLAVHVAAACSKAQTTSAPAGSVQLQPYTAPDQSASAGVPSGWTVTTGSKTFIQMAGPQGETIFLGKTFIARNAPFQPGQKLAGGIDLAMPYSSNLVQKLTMIMQQGAAIGGQPAPQISFTSTVPLQLPPALGQCGKFVANMTGGSTPMKIMGAFCSLPLDSGGTYKNIILLAQAPAAVAAQEATIASAVFSSYKIPQAMLEKKLAPFTAPPPPKMPSGGAIPSSVIAGEEGADVSANCFDLGVIRQVPQRQLPKECGGTAPNN